MRLFLVTIALFFAPLASMAQCNGETLDYRLTDQDKAELATRIAATPFPRGLIWQAEKDGRDIILVGTMHLPDPRHADILAQAMPAIQNADLLLVEITPEGEEELQHAMASDPDLLLLPDNGTLLSQLPADDWANVAAAAEERGIPPFMAARSQPWYLQITLSIPSCAMTALQSGDTGLDGKIIDWAQSVDIPVQSVEDWRTTIEVMQLGTQQDQIDMLLAAVAEPAMTEEAAASTIADYFAGETARIWEIGRLTLHWTPGIAPERLDRLFDEFTQALLVDRNTAWIPVIETAASAHDTIAVAVGAGHLPGKDGLLFQLQQNGWEITRLD